MSKTDGKSFRGGKRKNGAPRICEGLGRWLVLLGTAVWLLRRRWVIRGWLEAPLRSGSGHIVGLQQLPYSGYRLQLKIVDGGKEMRAGVGFLGSTSWQVGMILPLIYWENGCFARATLIRSWMLPICPRQNDDASVAGALLSGL